MTYRNKTHGVPDAGPPPSGSGEVITKSGSGHTLRREALTLLEKLAAIGIALWLLLSFVFGVSIVHGEGMYPRVRDGDVTVWYRLESKYAIGDIVTFIDGGERQYGRIVAKGGDTVDFSQDGFLMVNGNAQQEEVFFPTSKENRAQSFPMVLGSGDVFILGDNRAYSVDSRDYGAVSEKMIEGKIITLMRRRGL